MHPADLRQIYPPFTTDIIQASTRVNYGQNLNFIHGLETMVCMAIEGAMQIEGGNWQIFDSMLKASEATVLLNSTVQGITKYKGKYLIKSSTLDSITEGAFINEEPYDTIVLAAPLQYANIDIEDGVLKHIPDVIPYVRLHVTLFTSTRTLNPLFFNLPPDAEVPTTILTTLPADEVPSDPTQGCGSPGFFSISTLRTVINPQTLEREKLYKIFSPHALTSEFLSGLLASPSKFLVLLSFSWTVLTAAVPTNLSKMNINSGDTITWYYPHVWNSYPYELPRITFEDSELARRFYYTSGMESFISTMETSALMGMNVARLIMDDYLQILGDPMGSGEKPLQMVMSEGENESVVQEL